MSSFLSFPLTKEKKKQLYSFGKIRKIEEVGQKYSTARPSVFAGKCGKGPGKGRSHVLVIPRTRGLLFKKHCKGRSVNVRGGAQLPVESVDDYLMETIE